MLLALQPLAISCEDGEIEAVEAEVAQVEAGIEAIMKVLKTT